MEESSTTMSHEETLDPEPKNEIDDHIFHNQVDTNSEKLCLIIDCADKDGVEQIVCDNNAQNDSKVKDYPSTEILETESNSTEGAEDDNYTENSDIDNSKNLICC